MNDSNDPLISSGLVSKIGQWYMKPFNAQGSVLNWSLFLVMAITISYLWYVILTRYIDLPEIIEG